MGKRKSSILKRNYLNLWLKFGPELEKLSTKKYTGYGYTYGEVDKWGWTIAQHKMRIADYCNGFNSKVAEKNPRTIQDSCNESNSNRAEINAPHTINNPSTIGGRRFFGDITVRE